MYKNIINSPEVTKTIFNVQFIFMTLSIFHKEKERQNCLAPIRSSEIIKRKQYENVKNNENIIW